MLSDGITMLVRQKDARISLRKGDMRGTVRGTMRTGMRMMMASEMLMMHLTCARHACSCFPKCHTFLSGKQQRLTNPRCD